MGGMDAGRSYDLERGQGLPTRTRGDGKRKTNPWMTRPELLNIEMLEAPIFGSFGNIELCDFRLVLWKWKQSFFGEIVCWILCYVQICLLRLFRKLIMICLNRIRSSDETLIVLCQQIQGRRSSNLYIRCFWVKSSFFPPCFDWSETGPLFGGGQFAQIFWEQELVWVMSRVRKPVCSLLDLKSNPGVCSRQKLPKVRHIQFLRTILTGGWGTSWVIGWSVQLWYSTTSPSKPSRIL